MARQQAERWQKDREAARDQIGGLSDLVNALRSERDEWKERAETAEKRVKVLERGRAPKAQLPKPLR